MTEKRSSYQKKDGCENQPSPLQHIEECHDYRLDTENTGEVSL